jgi:hypothetical protein
VYPTAKMWPEGYARPVGTSVTLKAKNARYKAVVTTEGRDLAGNGLDQSPKEKGTQQKA